MSAVVAFVTEEARDHHGRSLSDIFAMSNQELERQHDFIQWLFPLPTPSAAVPGSPVLSENDIEAIRSDPRCVEHLQRASDRMLQFYRFTRHWLRASDQNHLRITRIIKSLHLLVGKDAARRFYDDVTNLNAANGGPVGAASLRYWRDALERS